MNLGKLDMVKQEIRINIDILGISELKWMGRGDIIISTIVGKNPVEVMEWPS